MGLDHFLTYMKLCRTTRHLSQTSTFVSQITHISCKKKHFFLPFTLFQRFRPKSGSIFAAPLERDFQDVKIAWSPSFGDLPVDERVSSVIETQRSTFESLGCQVEEALPDFRDADEVFKVWRAWRFAIGYQQLIKTNRPVKDFTHIRSTQGDN